MRKKRKSIRGFFSGDKGQRTFNYAYSIGASVVILGSLFKLLHLPGADFMLILGMGTEATIFFLSSFDEPSKDYKWENVFPVLDDPNADPSQAPTFSQGGGGGGTVIIGNMPDGGVGVSSAVPFEGASMSAGSVSVSGSSAASVASASPFSTESAAELTAATEKYVRQINDMTEQLSRLQQITASLNDAQSTLLDSYNSLKGDEGSNANYAEQMQALSRNITGLNTIYEIQLKSVSSQLDTIDKVNAGLNNIRAMYENGSNDSFRIRQETEHMTQTLSQLNGIYERMLQAMTVNMGFAAARPAQPYAPSGYPVQPQTGYQQPQQPQGYDRQAPLYGNTSHYNPGNVAPQG